jgi:hypothetical protein
MDFRQIGAAQTSHPWHRVIACANRHKIEELLKTRRCVFCGNPGFSAKKNPSLPPRAIREGNEGI